MAFAGLSLALVTGVIALAGIGTVPEEAAQHFRNAIDAGLWGLGLAFLYFVPLLLAHAFDLRFLLRPEHYKGERLVGQASSTWAIVLGLSVLAAQFYFWAIGVLQLGQLARSASLAPT